MWPLHYLWKGMAFGTVIFPQYTLPVFYACFVNDHQLIGLTTTATYHARQQSEGRHHVTDPDADLCWVFLCNNLGWLSTKPRCLKTLSKGASLALRPPHNCRGHLPKRLVMMRLLVISVHVYYLASASLRLAHCCGPESPWKGSCRIIFVSLWGPPGRVP